MKLRVERSEARCGFELGLGLGVEAGLWDWLRWWRRRMGVSWLVGWDASEEVVLAREVVDWDGGALGWRVEVCILLLLLLLWRTGEGGRERGYTKRWVRTWESV